jgi:hypothetical protein
MRTSIWAFVLTIASATLASCGGVIEKTGGGGSGGTSGTGGAGSGKMGTGQFMDCQVVPAYCPLCPTCDYKYLCPSPSTNLPDDCLASGESGGSKVPYCCHKSYTGM